MTGKRQRKNSNDKCEPRAKRMKTTNKCVVSKKNAQKRGDQIAESELKSERAFNQSNTNNKMPDVKELVAWMNAPESDDEENTKSSKVVAVTNSFGTENSKKHNGLQSGSACNVSTPVHARTSGLNEIAKRDIMEVPIRPSSLCQIRTPDPKVLPHGSGLPSFPVSNHGFNCRFDSKQQQEEAQRNEHVTKHGYCHSVELDFQMGRDKTRIILRRDRRSRWKPRKMNLKCPGFLMMLHQVTSLEGELKDVCAIKKGDKAEWSDLEEKVVNEWYKTGDTKAAQRWGNEMRFIRLYRNAIGHPNSDATDPVHILSLPQTIQVCHNLMKGLWNFRPNDRYVHILATF